jgi:hypothetical protein
MARISQYQVDTNISDNDQLLGSDATNANLTKKFTVGDLSTYINGQSPGAPGSGTVKSVTGTGTVSGITLSGTVTSTGSLTLGGTLEIDPADITSAIGYTPYNASNPAGFTSFAEPAIFSGGGTPTLATGITAEEIRTLIGTGGGEGSGTVTSVDATAGTGISVSGGPITASGAITITNTAPDTGVPAILSDGSVPTLNTGITAEEIRTLIGAGDGGNTNLSTQLNSYSVRINSSTGNDIIILGATDSIAGVMTAADKTKLDDISVFKNFAVDGQTTVTADSISDTLTLVAGDNITIATDSDSDTITISALATLNNNFAEDITVNGVQVGAGSDDDTEENTRIGRLSIQTGSGDFNTAVGFSALRYSSTGQYNTAIGNHSMSQYQISGNSNVGVGYRSLRALGSGISNVAVGNSALVALSGGDANVAVGLYALNSLVNSNYNVGLGPSSLGGLVTGEKNVAIGFSAGGVTRNNLNDSVFIGHGSSANNDGQTNQIVIGALAVGNGSNTVTLGNNDITDTYLKGNVNIPGDLEVTGDTIGVVGNNTDTYSPSAKITQIVTLTQAQYDGIATPLASTLYIIL